MPPSLTLLADPAWDGLPVQGDRSVDLLACLQLAGADDVSVDRLVEELWADQVPANGVKALQVVVSRARKATAPGVIERRPQGYRLGECTVDAAWLDDLVASSAEALRAGQVAEAVELAREACGVRIGATDGGRPLGRLRDNGRAQQRQARRTLGLALAQSGAYDEALPALESAHRDEPADDEVLGALLLSEASTRGPAAALERYELHRLTLSERLGVDPSDSLQRVHLQLLMADSPQRHGVRYDADDLVGRDNDLGALLGLVAHHRVVTILGPGGLGKTRMAHLVARHATQPMVHVVELVGIRSGEDVVSEVGSALGVRDSVTTRSALTPAQRADVRSRIAAALDRSPALLVLDNCEHVVDAVAELVAFLVASAQDLRVLATSRTPLSIAAERVYPLAQLDADDAERLFGLRAVAVRPSVQLEHDDVAQVVSRLDGLPLAIELAAAKTRVMSVAEIGRRLENRFELLRGSDRAAPDRHRTLLAVIDWSWSLLQESERRALRRLSVFSDGFTLDGAEALVGPDALDEIQALVDQSLLSIEESDGRTRYRTLETVREFGRMHLVDAGEDSEAEAAQRDWALRFVAGADADLFSPAQPEAVARLLREETTLSDVLRRSLARGEQEAVVLVMAALGPLWTIRGEHTRVMMLSAPVDAVLEGYRPRPEAMDACRLTVATVAASAIALGPRTAAHSRILLNELGPGAVPSTAAAVRVTAALGADDLQAARAELEGLAQHGDRQTRALALRWLAHIEENQGDNTSSIGRVEQALSLWRPEDGVWARATLHMTLAQLAAQRGDLHHAARHAQRALPDLLRLMATDDAIDARSLIAMDAIRRGDLELARTLVEINTVGAEGPWIFGGTVVNLSVRAELELAEGRVEQGLSTYREMATAMQRMIPGLDHLSGVEPWVLYGLATAAAAHALHGAGEDLYDELARRLDLVVDDEALIDYPVLGVVLFALGTAGLTHGRIDARTAASMVVLAGRFSYARVAPSLAWTHAEALLARHGASEELAEAEARYGDRRGPDLISEARALAQQLAV